MFKNELFLIRTVTSRIDECPGLISQERRLRQEKLFRMGERSHSDLVTCNSTRSRGPATRPQLIRFSRFNRAVRGDRDSVSVPGSLPADLPLPDIPQDEFRVAGQGRSVAPTSTGLDAGGFSLCKVHRGF